MDVNTPHRRGRPRGFDAENALDQAIDVFWREGFEGADYTKLTVAMGITKPSIYAAFGDKNALFLKTLRRYAETTASVPLKAAMSQTTIADAAKVFFELLVDNYSGEKHPTGCLIVCVAMQCAETMPGVRSLLAAGLMGSDAVFRELLKAAVDRGELAFDFPLEAQSALWTDLTHALALRARTGASRAELEHFAMRATRSILG